MRYKLVKFAAGYLKVPNPRIRVQQQLEGGKNRGIARPVRQGCGCWRTADRIVGLYQGGEAALSGVSFDVPSATD